MGINLVFFTTPQLTKIINKILNQTTKYGKITFIESVLEDAVLKAKHIEQMGEVDVFITGGANTELLRKETDIPVIDIHISAFDILNAAMSIKKFSNVIALVVFRRSNEEIERIENLINVRIEQFVYKNILELKKCIKIIKDKNIKAVIGTTLPCDMADKSGLYTHLVYSRDAIFQSVERAYEVATTIQNKVERSERLKTIIDYAYSGIIVIDKKGYINTFNKAAENISGISSQNVTGESIKKVLGSECVENALKRGVIEIACIKDIGSTQALASTVPIKNRGQILGAVITLQDIGSIQKAEIEIRKNLHAKGLRARYTFDNIVGNNEKLKNTIAKAKSYSSSNSTILITGETGTGKELFAHSIHNFSIRRSNPFVAVNCAALPQSILESELFGYEEGAFTGARKGGKPGLFELAHKGTIFLDEISGIPLEIQSRLLRVLQEKEIMRLGSDKIVPVDIRIIAASNMNLNQLVQKGIFREDLFYRINALQLDIPSLRERLDDIPILISSFLHRLSPDLNNLIIPNVPIISDGLKRYHWPGNIRQLENIIERIIVSLDYHDNNVDVLPKILNEIVNNLYNVSTDTKAYISEHNTTLSLNEIEDLPQRVKVTDMEILRVLSKVKGNRTEAARKLNISRMTLWRRIKKMDNQN